MDATARALHYIDWHQQAYGSPATSEDVASILEKASGMSAKESRCLLRGMEVAGKIELVHPRHVSAGWRIKRTDAGGEG